MTTTTSTTTTVTTADICVAAAADAWRESGEILAHAVGMIPTIGARLAHATDAPDLVLTDGEAHLMAEPPPLGGTAAAGGVIEGWAPFRRIFDILATGRRHSMMGASQIDAFGNQNISLIGSWDHPKRQLIGVRGAPGNTANHRTDYWVSRHSARVFVPSVDVVSGVGNDRVAAEPSTTLKFHHLGVVITNLGVLDYNAEGRLRVRSVHPGVTVEQIQEATGFDIDVSEATETRVPTAEELELIAQLDPKGKRFNEVPLPASA